MRSSPLSTKRLLHFAEAHGAELRTLAMVGPGERLDPLRLADRFGIYIAELDAIQGVSETDISHLKGASASIWSGGGVPLPDGSLLVILHPHQTPERGNVTIMEEVAHRHLGHNPSQIVLDSSGAAHRVYDEQSEAEAYWTAAAALLPAADLSRAVWKGEPAEALANNFGISTDLVHFRVKILGLWKDFAALAA